MAGEVVTTAVGTLVADPELRFTSSGAAMTSFRIASTPRTFNKTTNAWEDGESLFLSCSVWRQYAENVAESLTKGMQVMVQGRLKQRSYQTQQGENRTVIELDVDDVGPTLRFATAKVVKAQRGGGNGGGQGGSGGDWGSGAGVQRSGGQSRPAEADPWATAGRQGGYSQEPPF